MTWLEIAFWLSLLIVFYTYIGYGLLLALLVAIKHMLQGRSSRQLAEFLPDVTLVVPSYNESDILEEKIHNCLALDYPEDKLSIMFITDGSTDNSPEIVGKYPRIKLLHSAERAGKSAAENRAIRQVKTPFVVFCDANTELNPEAIRLMVQHYADPKVGAVSGEKKVIQQTLDSASGAGEGLYWKYESFLKKKDAELHSLVGAAGELISFRTALFEPLEHDTILDDFIATLRIAAQGYKVAYEPRAFAAETPSASSEEEMKRKIRICAGGWQSMSRLLFLLNPFRYGILSFQYISHRVLRWSLTPLLLLLLLPLNLYLHMQSGGIYSLILLAQVFFYLCSLLGWQLESRKIRLKALFIPFYFSMMQVAVFAGFFRFIKGSQQASWEKVRRATTV
jgi:cellulose synthase/poly-beta-1,6-N-acetylglucosamine synthase-like glycosyltransferase